MALPFSLTRLAWMVPCTRPPNNGNFDGKKLQEIGSKVIEKYDFKFKVMGEDQKFDNIIGETDDGWDPLGGNGHCPDYVPEHWIGEHVGKRLVEAFAVLARTPCVRGPKDIWRHVAGFPGRVFRSIAVFRRGVVEARTCGDYILDTTRHKG